MEEINNKNVTRIEFEILRAMIESEKPLSQRALGRIVDKSPATVNRIMKDLENRGLLAGAKVTEEAAAVMEQFRARRAIFIAAGFGHRMMPITLNTPKPLVRVNGVMIIETMLDAVIAAGIEEIYIVRGYLADRFDMLLSRYPQIRFFDNPDYNEANNITSAMLVKDLFSNAYVLEGDLLLKNPGLITKYQYSCNYLGIYTDRTDDWCLEVKNRQVMAMKQGGINCYQMVGISYWNEQAGRRLAEDIPKAFEMPGGPEQFWDDVPLKFFRDRYHVEIRPCTREDVTEVDTFKELKAIDSSYGM